MNDDLAAVVTKELPGGARSVFSGMPIIKSELWARIFNDAGVHRYAAPGIYVRANARLVMVHAGKPGEYMVTLPRKAASVTDLYSGIELVRDSDRLLLKTAEPATWLLELK